MNITFGIPQRGPNSPASIPYRHDTPVQCDIQREAGDPAGAVLVNIVNCSADNGDASIVSGGELQNSGEVRVHGDRQTSPQHPRQLQLRAEFNGQEWFSDGFSVCSHPSAVENGPEHLPHVCYEDGTVWVGMFVRIRVASDSGVDADLNEVDDQEKVSGPLDHSPNLHGDPAGPSGTGKPEPAHTARIDRHRTQLPELVRLDATHLNGATGEWANDQLDVFVCRRCGMQHLGLQEVVPSSGYRVIRRIVTDPLLNRLRFVVRKEPRPSAIQEVKLWNSGPGPSGPFEVTLDLEEHLPTEHQRMEEWSSLAFGARGADGVEE